MQTRKPKLQFTGERLIPEVNKGEAFFYEHLIRYLFSCQFVKEKVVLDAGCGSGYGSYILLQNGKAKQVYGVDISSQAIEYANYRYKAPNINFLTDDIESLDKIEDKSIDVIVSFETIEHLHNQEKFLAQVKRVLTTKGIVFISTPNAHSSYLDNPFHIKELSPKEFYDVLKKKFENVNLLYQSFEFSQSLKECNKNTSFSLEENFVLNDQKIYSPNININNSQYLLAMCSDSKLPSAEMIAMSSYKIGGYDLSKGFYSLNKQFNMLHDNIKILSQQLDDVGQEYNRVQQDLYNANKELDYIKYSKFFKLWPLYTHGKLAYRSILINIIKQSKIIINFIIKASSASHSFQLWIKKNYPTDDNLKNQNKNARKFKYKPKISILTPTYNTPENFLRECLDSVINQSYDNWELCIADDASVSDNIRKIIQEYAQQDDRIKYIFRKENGHISQASNSALKIASGKFIGLLDHDDILWPNALFEVVTLLNKNPRTDFIYSDEDKLEEDGITHSDPFFKPDWSPDYLRSINYITHFSVIRKSLMHKIGGFRPGLEGAQDWDLFLRLTRLIKDHKKILHIPTVLYSWRKSPSSTASEKYGLSTKSYAYENQKKVLEDDLKARGYHGKIETTKNLGSWRVRYQIIGNPLVSIIIPTKDKYEYIEKCLSSIIKHTTYKNYELIIIDTGSTDNKVWQLYELMKIKWPKIRVIKWKKEFNFSSVCNLGAKESKGNFLLFLNNDTQVRTPDWIEGLLEHAQRSEVGAVGCKLVYPDNRIQHLGGILGMNLDSTKGGFAGHAYRFIPAENFSSFDASSIKNYSFVTAACLLIEKSKFAAVGGFDENFKIAVNDIDLCLKLYYGKRIFNLVNPLVELFHNESVSVAKPGEKQRNLNQWENEIKIFTKKWKSKKDLDPFYNSNLTLTKEDFSLKILGND